MIPESTSLTSFSRRSIIHLLTAALLTAVMVCASTLSHAQTNNPLAFRGVNLAGAEFGFDVLPGTYNIQYRYPSIESADYYQSKNLNTIRLPFRWERLQRTQFGQLDATELSRLRNYINGVTAKGINVILDPHNYSRYFGEVIGAQGSSVSTDAFADFWRRLANQFRQNDRVMLGIMNEPHTMPTRLWLNNANAAIAAIRSTGATNLVLVPGVAYTGAFTWFDNFYGTPNAQVMGGVVDSGNNFVIEAHQYLDSDGSGTDETTCVSTTIGSERLQRFTQWLRDNNLRGFLGEFGAPSASVCIQAMDDMLNYMEANGDVWIGWTYWAGGPWWGDYGLSVEPENGQDKPQMAVLENHSTPSEPPTGGMRLVTTQDRTSNGGYGWLIDGNTKQWVDGSCRQRLSAAGLTLESQTWSAIASFSDVTIFRTCNELVNAISGNDEPGDGGFPRIIITPDKQLSGEDGWVLFADRTKVWITPQCRQSLEGLRFAVDVLPWPTIDAYPDGPVRTCAEIAGTTDPTDPSDPSVSILVTVDKLPAGNYGWVLFSNGRKLWVDASCRSRLQATGATVQTLPWSSIAAYPDATYQSCDEIVTVNDSNDDSDGDPNKPRVVTTSDRASSPNYGWLHYPDNTKLWIDSNCRSQFESNGYNVVVLAWADIATFTDRASQPCSSLP